MNCFHIISSSIFKKLTSGTVGAQCPLLTLEYFKALHILEVSCFDNFMKFITLHYTHYQKDHCFRFLSFFSRSAGLAFFPSKGYI